MSDFGNVYIANIHQYVTFDITTRPYRSPEIMLGIPYGPGVDVFACGTMFYELATCQYLFYSSQNHQSNNEKNLSQLRDMTDIMGPFPMHMIKRGKYGVNYFNRKCEFLSDSSHSHSHPLNKTHPKGNKYRTGVVIFDHQTQHQPPLKTLIQQNTTNIKGHEEKQMFLNLLSHMLELDPSKRWDARQCKNHPWLKQIHDRFLKVGDDAFLY